MLIERIALENFGVYRGRQLMHLAPPDSHRPIILIGGLNGSGKTTLLDALQLAFFGKLARCSNRGNMAYESFLERCIHRGADPVEGACIELRFQFRSEGRDHRYDIERRWAKRGKTIKEWVSISRDGEHDRVLSSDWDEQVGQFVQPDILELFFFDGEKIADIVGKERTAQFLKTAVHSLLGLENVARLHEDMLALARRKKLEETEDDELAAKISRTQEEHDRLHTLIMKLQKRRADKLRLVDDHKKILSILERKFHQEGGGLFAKVEEIQQQREETKAELKRCHADLQRYVAGPAPLLLVRGLLSKTLEQARREQESKRNGLIHDLLSARDDSIIGFLGKQNQELARSLERFLADDRQTRKENTEGVEAFLQMDDMEVNRLEALLSTVLPDEEKKAGVLRDRHDALTAGLEDLNRQLANIPKAETITQIVADMEKKRALLAELTVIIEQLDKEIAQRQSEAQQAKARLDRFAEISVERGFKQEESALVVDKAEQMATIMEAFKQRITTNHLRRLEINILESLHNIMRKKNLVREVHIDAEDMTLILIGQNQERLPMERFSAGELQLIAVAMVWGLTKAAERPLPCIIDTPLGRLDSEHRHLLLENYYPNASHQVILLSTDEEIDETYLPLIKNQVGRAYRLSYDESREATTIMDGYFMEGSLVTGNH